MIDTLPVAAGSALLLLSIRWPHRWVPRLLGAAAAAVGVAGVARFAGDGDLSDVGVAVAVGLGGAAEVLSGERRVLASASPPSSRTAATTAASTARARRGAPTGPSGGGAGAMGGGE